MKKLTLSLLCLALLLSALGAASAAEVPDLSREGSISLTMTYQGQAVPGGRLTLYRVADVTENDGNFSFTYTGSFSACTIPANTLSAAQALALAKLASDNGCTGTTQTISDQGKAAFSALTPGLYLLVQNAPASGYQAAAPFLVSVPGRENGHYVYDVDASPKLSLEKAPAETTKSTESATSPTTSGDKLPQTGQLHWPVPVLLAAGLTLIAAGWYLTGTGRKHEHED